MGVLPADAESTAVSTACPMSRGGKIPSLSHSEIRSISKLLRERAMVYPGATEEQIAAHRSALRQGSNHVRLLTNGENLLKFDWEKAIAGSKWIEFCGSASVNQTVRALKQFAPVGPTRS
jgi:hypothetical protein